MVNGRRERRFDLTETNGSGMPRDSRLVLGLLEASVPVGGGDC